jgi:hypothetical protein
MPGIAGNRSAPWLSLAPDGFRHSRSTSRPLVYPQNHFIWEQTAKARLRRPGALRRPRSELLPAGAEAAGGLQHVPIYVVRRSPTKATRTPLVEIAQRRLPQSRRLEFASRD